MGSLAAEVRSLIGLYKWMARTDSWLSGCDELEAFKEHCLQERVALGIRQSLRYTVKEDASPQQILGDLLRQVGVKLANTRKRIDGKAVREYRVDQQALAELKAVTAKRAEKRENLSTNDLQGDPPP